MRILPAGIVTLLFTDIEGSTRLWEQRPDEMARALALHDRILREEIEAAGGAVFKTVGDAFHAAFADPFAAVMAAVNAQRRLFTSDLPFRARMAVHTGEPSLRGEDYFGPPVNRIARILATAHGGQTLLSAAARHMIADRLPNELRLIEHGAHRLKDLSEPEELFQLAHPELPVDFPPLRSLSSHAQNLPAQLTSFIGRETELEDLRTLLDSGARLVTVTGPGGTGKTRLALHLAADRIEQYPGGVWWVDLSSVRDADRVLPAVASALGIAEEPGRQILSQMAERLVGATALILLDNFEQVLEAACDTLEILRACPTVTLLVTSRAALNVTGEHDYTVSELDVAEATALFVSRAQQVQARFALDEQTQPIIETICRRLDGIPLAIELAAAQARILPVAHIEKQLDRRFRTLVSPFRDVSQRQRTLRSAVDWSYDLLGELERALFARLSVFAGGFSFEAAEAVGDSSDVFYGIARLREQSLLRADEEGTLPRFRMLETLREYGLEKLNAAGDIAAVQSLHAAHFADLASRENARMEGAPREEAAANLDEDAENLRLALDWLIGDGSPDEAARMCGALGRYWEARGRIKEASQAIDRCLALESRLTDHQTLAQLLGWAGWFAHLRGDHQSSDPLQLRSLAICRELRDRYGESRALNHLALTAAGRRHLDHARDWYEQSLQIARELGDTASQAATLNNLALLAMEEARVVDAERFLEEALSLYRSRQDQTGIAASHCNLGELAIRNHEWPAAISHLTEGLDLFRRLEEKRGVAACLGSLAHVLVRQSRPREAREYAREALDIYLAAGMLSLTPPVLEVVAKADAMEHRLEGAEFAMQAAIRLRHDYDLQPTEPERELVDSVDFAAAAQSQAIPQAQMSLEDILAGVQKSIAA